MRIPLTWKQLRAAKERESRIDLLLMFLYGLLGLVLIISVFAFFMLWAVVMEKNVGKHATTKGGSKICRTIN